MNENMEIARSLITTTFQNNWDRFIKYNLLTPQWWIQLAFTVIPWLIWAKVVDRKRMLEILMVGLIIAIITKLLDLIGYNLSFWDYPFQLLPLVPEAFAFDLSLIPVAYMLIYQYLKPLKTYYIGLVSLSIIYAFIGEPLVNWLMLVVYIKWKYLYSVVYYIVIGIIVRAIVDSLKRNYEGLSSCTIKKQIIH